MLSDPKNGPIYILKLDISDGFYRIALNIDDIPKLGVVFPSPDGEEPLVALPLVIPMGWKNSPPAFCVATETAADLANDAIQSNVQPSPHPLNKHAVALDEQPSHSSPPAPSHTTAPLDLPPSSLMQAELANTTSPSTPSCNPPPLSTSLFKETSIPTARDPSLPSHSKLAAYVDVFMDNFIALAQGHDNRQRVRKLLLHAVDKVFRPNDYYDPPSRREPVSLSKLRKGDCSWTTIKNILGWIINTVAGTIELPLHRQERLGTILASIPVTQKRTTVKKWHRLLGELRSVSLTLPGARNIFSAMQNALVLSSNNRIAL